jgi:hypothetical protein
MNILAARMHLDQVVIERQAAGQPADIDQIDLVVCEDGATVMAYVYFIGASDDDCLVFPFDLPCPAKLFDRRYYAAAMLRSGGETVH